jgi:hypothetical protein
LQIAIIVLLLVALSPLAYYLLPLYFWLFLASCTTVFPDIWGFLFPTLK